MKNYNNRFHFRNLSSHKLLLLLYVMVSLCSFIQMHSLVSSGQENGKIWCAQVVDDIAAGSDQTTSSALDMNDHPRIGYVGSNGLKYASWTGSTWNLETIDSLGSYKHLSLALDIYDYPHLIYHDTNGDGSIKHRYWTGSTWNIETVRSACVFGNGYNDIVIDQNSVLHVVFHEDCEDKIYYATYSGNNWTIESSIHLASRGNDGFCSIALDSNFTPHICFISGENVHYGYWNGDGWDIQTIYTWGETCICCIAIDSNDYPHICFENKEDVHANWWLRYAHWTGYSWVIDTLYTGSSESISLALDSNDRPYIVYDIYGPESYSESLICAEWTEAKWSTTTIDSGSYSIYNCISFSFDSKDVPHVSYRGNGKLKYAVYTNIPATPNNLNGPELGIVGENYDYSASTVEPDGDQLYYMFDWGDGTTTDWIGAYLSNSTVIASHSWNNPGTFNIRIKAKDIYGAETGWSIPTAIEAENRIPNVPSCPSGHEYGYTNILYNYSVSATDPDDDSLYYLIDWGDGTTSDWMGPFASGVTAIISHSWINPDTYNIQAKTKDIHGAETDWSNSLTIEIQNFGAPSTPLEVYGKVHEDYVELSWNPPSSDGGYPLVNYKLYKSVESGSESLYETVSSIELSFTDNNVEAGETYHYRISAVNNVGSSASSDMGTIECSWGDVIAHTLQKWSWVFVLIVVIIGSIVLGKKGFSKYKERRQFLKTEMKSLETEKKDIINMIRKMTRK